MIDLKIIAVSRMRKYGGAEVFRNLIVELMAGSQSNYDRRTSDPKITPPYDAKMMKVPQIAQRPTSFSFWFLPPQHLA